MPNLAWTDALTPILTLVLLWGFRRGWMVIATILRESNRAVLAAVAGVSQEVSDIRSDVAEFQKELAVLKVLVSGTGGHSERLAWLEGNSGRPLGSSRLPPDPHPSTWSDVAPSPP